MIFIFLCIFAIIISILWVCLYRFNNTELRTPSGATHPYLRSPGLVVSFYCCRLTCSSCVVFELCMQRIHYHENYMSFSRNHVMENFFQCICDKLKYNSVTLWMLSRVNRLMFNFSLSRIHTHTSNHS